MSYLKDTQVMITVSGGFKVVAYGNDNGEPDVLRGVAIQEGEDTEEIVDAILEAVREHVLDVLTSQQNELGNV